MVCWREGDKARAVGAQGGEQQKKSMARVRRWAFIPSAMMYTKPAVLTRLQASEGQSLHLSCSFNTWFASQGMLLPFHHPYYC